MNTVQSALISKYIIQRLASEETRAIDGILLVHGVMARFWSLLRLLLFLFHRFEQRQSETIERPDP